MADEDVKPAKTPLLIPRMNDQERKDFVRDWLKNHIFSSCHLRPHDEGMLGHVFYPVLFGGVLPEIKEPEFPEEIPEDMAVEDFDRLHDNRETILENWRKANDHLEQQYKQQLGLIWEYWDKSLPRSINGYPIFMSCRVMHIDDWNRIWPVIEKEEKRIADLEV